MFLHDAIGYRQPEAGAAADALSGEEWIVNLGYVVGCNTDAGVGNFYDQRIVIVAVAGGQRDAAVAVGDRVARVQNQIRKDLLQLDRVAVHLGQLVSIVAHDFDLAAAQLRLEQLQRVVEDPVNIDPGKFRSAAGA